MITETIYGLILVFGIVSVLSSLYFKNEALGAFSIIIFLMLALFTFPASGGVRYTTGANISSVQSGFTISTIITDKYDTFSNTYLGMAYILISFYMTLQIITYRKNKAEEAKDNEVRL